GGFLEVVLVEEAVHTCNVYEEEVGLGVGFCQPASVPDVGDFEQIFFATPVPGPVTLPELAAFLTLVECIYAVGLLGDDLQGLLDGSGLPYAPVYGFSIGFEVGVGGAVAGGHGWYQIEVITRLFISEYSANLPY